MPDAPYVLTVGADPERTLGPTEVAQVGQRFVQTSLCSLVEDNPECRRGIHYVLVSQDDRGDIGPYWLTFYELESEDAARRYLGRSTSGGLASSPQPDLDLGGVLSIRWTVLWRQIRTTSGSTDDAGEPYLYLVGMDPAPEAGEEGRREFNDFYNQFHLPEVVECCAFLRASRYECYAQIVYPQPGSPEFMAVYEGEEEALCKTFRKQPKIDFPVPSGGYTEPGPAAWSGRSVPWRLTYRRLGAHVRSALL